jgi:CrcB protein
MKKYLYIAVLGFLGSICRHALTSAGAPHSFPLCTLLVNVFGSFAFSFIVTLAYEMNRVDQDLRIGLTAGFLGAFTTMSTFCRQTAGQLVSGSYAAAAVYVFISLSAGILAAQAGAAVVKLYIKKTQLFHAPEAEDAED